MCDRSAGPPPPKRLRISELNPHLLCALCGGYLIDATTIIECLHSFCKTCILRYLETSNYCPICEVLIHKTRPWQNIRLDHSLQNAVYKMVPGLFQNEMRRRREFYEKQNLHDKRSRSSSQPQGELGDRIIFSQDEEFSISIEFSPDGKPVKEVTECKAKSLKRPKGKCQPDKRYLKCPAALRIEHLKKFIRSKFSLPQTLEIDLFYETETLSDTFSLMDVAYIYEWKRDCVLRLFYSFYEIPSKLRKVEAVTNVTEKITKNKVKDKSDDKAGKRDKDKRAKGKREKSKEKKQGKLSGKRKVSSDGVTSASNTSSKRAYIVTGETAEDGPVLKCKEVETATMGDALALSKNTKLSLDISTCPKMDKLYVNNLVSDGCSNRGHLTFESSPKQRRPPDNTSYSIIAHSGDIVSNILPSGQDTKTSIKFLIKSSDIKGCKGQTGEAPSDTKFLNGNTSSKVKVMKYQNGETGSISNSNLFEKMDTFAKSTQATVKELISLSDSSSSHVEIVPNNYKKLKEGDVKCGIKLNMNITIPKSTSKCSQQLNSASKCSQQLNSASKCSQQLNTVSKSSQQLNSASKCSQQLNSASRCSQQLNSASKSSQQLNSASKCSQQLNSASKCSQELNSLKLSQMRIATDLDTDQSKQNEEISLTTIQVAETKSGVSHAKSNTNISLCNVTFKEDTITETKDVTLAAQSLKENIYNIKVEPLLTEPGQTSTGGTVGDALDIVPRVQQDESFVTSQSNDEKEEILGPQKDTCCPDSYKQNSSKQALKNTAPNIAKTKQNSDTRVLTDTIQNNTKQVVNDTKQMCDEAKQNITKQVHDTRQRSDETKQNSTKQMNDINQKFNDTKQNSSKQMNDTRQKCDDNKQNSSKQMNDTRQKCDDTKQHSPKRMNDTMLRCDDTKPNSTKQVNDTRQRCNDITQNSSKQFIIETKQMVDSKLHNAKLSEGECQQRSNWTKQAIEQGIPETKPALNICSASLPKTKQIISNVHVNSHKLQNGNAKRPENKCVDSLTIPVKKEPKMQEFVVSKVMKDARGSNDPLFHLQEQGFSKSVTENLSQQTCSPSVQKLSSPSHQNSGTTVLVSKSTSLSSDITAKITPAVPKERAKSHKVTPSSTESLVVSSAKPVLVSVTSTNTTLSELLPTHPKLLNIKAVSTTASSSCLTTTYSIASIVSMSAVNFSSSKTSAPISTSMALSTSTTSTTTSATFSKACDVMSNVMSITSAATIPKTTLAVPLVPPVTVPTVASSLSSRATDTLTVSKKEKDTEKSPTSLVPQVKCTASTSSSSPLNSSSTCMSSTSFFDNTTPTTVLSIALSVTATPTASSLASSTTAITTTISSVAMTTGSNWSTNTTVNVANTFLNVPPSESSPLKATQARTNPRASEASSINTVIPKEAIKLDNFLFDIKAETEAPLTVSSQKLKDSCTVVRQAQKNSIRPKTDSSAQLHGFTNEKGSQNTQSHITAIHFLPKTISHTSKQYSAARSMSASSTSATKYSNVIQTTKISTLIPKSSSISSKAGAFSKSFSYPSTINSVPSSRSFLHTSLTTHASRPDLTAVMNGTSYERAMLHKASALTSSLSVQTSSAASSASHHRTSSKHGSKDGDNKMEKGQKNKAIPPLTIPKSCLVGTTLKLQRSPGSTDHYIFAPLSHYSSTTHHNGERPKSKEVKHNGSKTPTSPPTPTKDCVFLGERQRVPTIKISDINRNPIIVDSSGSGNSSNRHHSQYRSYSHGSTRSSVSENGSSRAHSRGGSDSNSPSGSSDRSDRSPARDSRRPSDSELLMTHHWHEYSAADLLFNGFKLPSHPKFHDLHYDTDAMPLDYSQSSSKS